MKSIATADRRDTVRHADGDRRRRAVARLRGEGRRASRPVHLRPEREARVPAALPRPDVVERSVLRRAAYELPAGLAAWRSIPRAACGRARRRRRTRPRRPPRSCRRGRTRAPRAPRAAARRGRARSRAGRSTRFSPARWAASDFSRMPPIGSTWPVSVISPVMPTSSATGSPRTSEAIAVAIVTPAEGPSFGTAPAGTWMWTSCVANQSSGKPELRGVRAHPRERRLRRLLHHLAELARDRQLALARIRGRLDEEHVAADGGVGEPGRDAGIGRAPAHLAREPPRPEPRRAAARRRRASSALAPSPPASPPCGRASASRRSRLRTPASRVYSRITSRSTCPRASAAPLEAVRLELLRHEVALARSRASRPRCSPRAGSRPSGRAAARGSCRACSRCR